MDWLLVGLGNPGREYQDNRHNVGFMALDELAKRAGSSGAWKSKFGGEIAPATVGSSQALLLKPMQYMNRSGLAVVQASAFYKIPPERIVALHDEIDMELGRIQVKVGGGHGGHNGLRSITQELATPDFLRVRLGVGRPRTTDKEAVANWVLANFAKADGELVKMLIADGADAAEAVIKDGVATAMNRFNQKKQKVL